MSEFGDHWQELTELKFPNGRRRTVKSTTAPAVECWLYIGKFGSRELQDRADTKMWYTFMSGDGQAIQGEGRAPDEAVKDAISRTEEMLRLRQRQLSALRAALPKREE